MRFAIVGFSLAGVYSAIYWYLATYVMDADAGRGHRLPGLGQHRLRRCTAAGASAATARERRPPAEVKFLLVQLSGFVLNEVFTWVLTGPMHGPTWWPLVPAIFVTPLATFALNRQLVFR